jgi:hypothetical protein
VVDLEDRVKRRTKAAGLEVENLMARAEGEEQMSVNYTLAVEPPRRPLTQVVD